MQCTRGQTPCEEPREANLQLLFSPFNCSFQFPQSLSISAVTDSFNYNQRSCGVQENSSSLTYYISLWNSNLFSLVHTWWISSPLNYHLLCLLLVTSSPKTLVMLEDTTLHFILATNCQRMWLARHTEVSQVRGGKSHQMTTGREPLRSENASFFPLQSCFSSPKLVLALLRFIDLDMHVASLTDFMATATYFLFLLIMRK